jgi:hypothetical protein
MQRIGSGFFWNQLTFSTFGKARARCACKGQKTPALDETSHQNLGEGPDATLLHKTFRWPVPATG